MTDVSGPVEPDLEVSFLGQHERAIRVEAFDVPALGDELLVSGVSTGCSVEQHPPRGRDPLDDHGQEAGTVVDP